jgi:hypothetical protein
VIEWDDVHSKLLVGDGVVDHVKVKQGPGKGNIFSGVVRKRGA